MSHKEVQSVPQGMHTVTPRLTCAGAADAIAFYEKAFNATSLQCLKGPQGHVLNAAIRIGDSTVMLEDELPGCGNRAPNDQEACPVTVHLYVDDVDALFAQAVTAGATTIMALEDTFWGDRFGVLKDPFGHQWSLATHIRDVPSDEMQRAADELFGQGGSA